MLWSNLWRYLLQVLRFFLICFVSYNLTLSLLGAEDSLLKEAKIAFSRKAYQEAVKKFTQYSETHPNDGIPLMYMGYIYEYKKDYPRSIYHFRRSVELNLDREQKKTVLLKLALFFQFHQDWNLAATYASRFLKIEPKNEEMQKIYQKATLNRGVVVSNPTVSLVEKKEDEIDKTPSKKKELEKQDKVTGPEKIEKADKIEKPDKSSSTSEKSDKTEKNSNEDDLWEKALTLVEEKKWDQAESLLANLIERDPNRTRYFYKMGIVKLRKEDAKSAIEFFDKAKKNPFSKDTNVFLYFIFLNEGLAFQKLNQSDKAEESFKKAIAQQEKDVPYLALSRMKHQATNWSECFNFADQAVNLGGQTEAHMFRFVCGAEDGKPTEVWQNNFEKFSKFLEKSYNDPATVPEKFQIGFLRLARQLTATGKPEKAEPYFEIVGKDPNLNQSREYLFYRGRNLFYIGKTDEGLSYLNKVPNSSAAYYMIARAYARKKDLAKTKEHIAKAGQLKAEYWDFASNETDFQEFRKDQSFLEFLKNKGN